MGRGIYFTFFFSSFPVNEQAEGVLLLWCWSAKYYSLARAAGKRWDGTSCPRWIPDILGPRAFPAISRVEAAGKEGQGIEHLRRMCVPRITREGFLHQMHKTTFAFFSPLTHDYSLLNFTDPENACTEWAYSNWVYCNNTAIWDFFAVVAVLKGDWGDKEAHSSLATIVL